MSEFWVDEKGVRRAGVDPRLSLDQHAEQAMSVVGVPAPVDVRMGRRRRGTGTLLLSDRQGRHRCVPPMRRLEVRVPTGSAGTSTGRNKRDSSPLGPPPSPYEGQTLVEAPEKGATWDCPDCSRVWVVLSSERGRFWVHALWADRRRHRRRLLLAQEGGEA